MRRDSRDSERNTSPDVGVRVVRLLSGAVSITVLTALLLCLLFGIYALWDSHQLYAGADAREYEKYKPTEEDDRTFADFKRLNDEVIGWLTVYGTAIDYPVVQADDNKKYLNLAADGTFQASGSIFLDYRNAPDFSDFNSIVFGHHMAQSAMFGDIGNFLEKEYFDTHKYGTLYADGRLWGIDFFAILQADAYDGALYTPAVSGEAARRSYLSHIRSLAAHTRELSVGTDDRIVLLSTCTEDVTNGRMLLVGKLTEEVRANPFPKEEKAQAPGADLFSFFKQWSSVPLLVWAVLLLIILLIVLKIGDGITERYRKRKKAREIPKSEREATKKTTKR